MYTVTAMVYTLTVAALVYTVTALVYTPTVAALVYTVCTQWRGGRTQRSYVPQFI